MNKLKKVAILAHWRTGTTLLRNLLSACGMKDCVDEFGIKYGDINGVGNSVSIKAPTVVPPAKIVADTLRSYDEQAALNGWECYGLKSDHSLQDVCWEAAGKPFLDVWPDATYIISIQHPAGIIRSFQKLGETIKLDPNLTVQEITDSWLSTYEATKRLIDEKGAIVIAYPDSYTNGHIQHVVEELGLTWTAKARAMFDPDMVDDTTGVPEDSKGFAEAVAMYEEFKKYAVIPEPPEVVIREITTPSVTFQLQDEERLKTTMDEIAKITVDKLPPSYKRTDSVRSVQPGKRKKRPA